jgi:rhodopsin domain-containing protein
MMRWSPSPGYVPPDPLIPSVPVLTSQTIFVPFTILCVRLIQIGSGRHYEYIQYVMTMETVEVSEIWDFIAHLLYTTSLLVCRLSGLAFYHRLCAQHRGFLVTIRSLAAVLAAGYIAQMALIIFHCLPVTGLWPYDWQPGFENYTCLTWGVVYSVNSSVSLLCDLLLFGIPIAMLRMLHMPPRQKVQLAGILLPGIG